MSLLQKSAEAAPAENLKPASDEPSMNAEERLEKLNALGLALAEKRKLAIEARAQSGIEEQWTQDQEFFEGIDDANRNERSNDSATKPPGQAAPKKAEVTTGSTIFPNITAPYCEAAAARIADMLLPSDDKNFEIRPTPIPDLVSLSEGKVPRTLLQDAARQFPGQPDMAKQKIAEATQKALEVIELANDRAKKAQSRIEDWLVEAQWHAEVRKVIEDSARIGSGVLKGPVPVKRKSVGLDEQSVLTIKEKIVPGSKKISCWDLFPDLPGCGDNIHNGSFTFERDRFTQKQLLDLKGLPGYIPEAIDACLKEGPLNPTSDPKNPTAMTGSDKSRFEVWFFHGFLNREELMAAGCKCEGDGPVNLPAIITMVNNRVVKAALNPLDTGDFPYDVMPWRKKAGMPWGDGVARQIRTPQRIVTAALRTMMVNAGRAAGPIVVWDQGKLVPADGKNEITPWKLLYVGEDASIDDVRKAITHIEFPIYQAELERIIQIGLKLAEDVTGLPLILQGQQGKAPDTVGGMQLLNDNASSVLRRLARTFDDCITEPHIRRYYVWVLQYGEAEEKGDFQIDARGSSALVERSIQNQELANIVQAALNPAFGIDPKKAMREYLKSRKLDPKAFEFDDEEWKQIVENMKKGPSDPRLAVAQLRAQLEERLKQMDQQFEAQENAKDRQLDAVLAEFNGKVEAMRMSGDRANVVAEIKAALADTVMKLRQQKEFYIADAAMDMRNKQAEHQERNVDRMVAHTDKSAQREHDMRKHTTPQAANPPMEPNGQAPKGKAFAH